MPSDELAPQLDTHGQGARDVDDAASAQRVHAFRAANPHKTPDELADMLIRSRCLQVAGVGAATAGAAVLPSIGALAAVAVGSITDLNATHQMQVELVQDIATIYAYQFKPGEKQQYMALALGLNVGNSPSAARNAAEQLLANGGRQLAHKATQRLARKSAGRALPVVGVATSVGSNILMTHAAAQRAKAYIKSGPESVGNLENSIRASLNLDEVALSELTVESLSRTLANSMSSASDALLEGFDQGAQLAGRAAGRATRKLITFWRNTTSPKD